MSSTPVRALSGFIAIATALLVAQAVADSQVPISKTITKISTYEAAKHVVLDINPPLSGNETGEHCTETSKVVIKDTKRKSNDRNDDGDKDRKNADNKALLTAATVAYVSGKQAGFGLSGCSTVSDDNTRTIPVIYRLDY